MIGAEQLRAQVLAALDRVIDPCSRGRGLPAGLVEMGMVEGVVLADGAAGATAVTVEARLTSPACHFQQWFDERIRREVAAVPGVSGVSTRWSKEFDWTDADMSPRLRRRVRAKRDAARAMTAPR